MAPESAAGGAVVVVVDGGAMVVWGAVVVGAGFVVGTVRFDGAVAGSAICVAEPAAAVFGAAG
jgi:hypothetical protein